MVPEPIRLDLNISGGQEPSPERSPEAPGSRLRWSKLGLSNRAVAADTAEVLSDS
jgi:hypothetical protein